MLFTTTESVPGHVVERLIQLIWGEAATRAQAADAMTAAAQQMGANAVVGVRWGPGVVSYGIGQPAQFFFIFGTAAVIRALPAE